VAPWLWEQHNEHRLPVPRLAYFGAYRASGDFRAGMVLQVLLLSALSLRLTSAVAAIRGRPSWADVFVPVGLLNWGHAENFLMGYQVNFALICVLACEMLLRARAGAAVAVGVLLLVLEGCGASGLVFVPPVGGWLIWRAWRGKSAVLAGLVLAAVGYAGLYFVGYERPAHHPPARPEHAGLAVLITGEYLAMGFGLAAAAVWPVVAVGVVGLTAATAGRLVRVRDWGVLAVLGGAVLLAAAVGVGRAGFGHWDMGLWSRYGLLAWPVLFAGYLGWTGVRQGPGRWVQPALAAASLGLLPFNVAAGWQWGAAHDRRLSAVSADLAAGVPADAVVAKHLSGTGQEERARAGIPMLRGRP
jgi:hypothetical protein